MVMDITVNEKIVEVARAPYVNKALNPNMSVKWICFM